MDADIVIIGRAIRGMDIDAPVVLSRDDRRRHLHIIGRTGTGKTTLLKALIFDDLAAGRDFALIDPLGGLAEAVVDAVPREFNDKAVYFAPSEDLEHVIGFNPLDHVTPDRRHLVADHIVQSFLHVWGGSLEDSPRLIYILYNSLRLLLDTPGSTLLGLPRLLVDDAYRNRLLGNCQDLVVHGFWRNEFAAYDDKFRAAVISPVQNKIGMLLAPPALRNIVGQPRSTLDIARLMNRGGILIANLAKGKMGATGTQLLGAFLATTIAQVAEERVSIPYEERRDFNLYVDEIQNVATTSFASTLSEARNFKLSVCGAHQYLGQLPIAVRQAFTGNVGSTVVFRVGAEDSRALAHELDIDNPAALMGTPNFSAWARLLQDGNPTDPFPLKTVMVDPPAADRKTAVVAHTRARHCRSRAAVEASINRQLKG